MWNQVKSSYAMQMRSKLVKSGYIKPYDVKSAEIKLCSWMWNQTVKWEGMNTEYYKSKLRWNYSSSWETEINLLTPCAIQHPTLKTRKLPKIINKISTLPYSSHQTQPTPFTLKRPAWPASIKMSVRLVLVMSILARFFKCRRFVLCWIWQKQPVSKMVPGLSSKLTEVTTGS